jgi:hypothetical protein
MRRMAARAVKEPNISEWVIPRCTRRRSGEGKISASQMMKTSRSGATPPITKAASSFLSILKKLPKRYGSTA